MTHTTTQREAARKDPNPCERFAYPNHSAVRRAQTIERLERIQWEEACPASRRA